MHILNHQAPGLAQRLAGLSLDQRRKVLGGACYFASRWINPLEPGFRDLLECTKQEGALSPLRLEETRALAESADERYLYLKEHGAEETEWLLWFGKARLLNAVLMAFGAESPGSAADALYELSVMTEDPSPLMEFVACEIGLLER